MMYGKRWLNKFGFSAAVWVGFHLYFFFFIQDARAGYLGYLDILFLVALVCLTGGDYRGYRVYRRERERMMGQEELICRTIPDFENQDIAEHDVGVMERQMDRLYEENRSLQDYVARWGHELKIPLAAGLLMDERIEDKELRMELREQLERMKRQINSLLLGCKLQSPLLDIQVKRTRLGECVRTSLKNNRFFLIQKGFEIQADIGEDTVYTDASWMVYVLDQLVSNAIKYSGKFQAAASGEEASGEAVSGENTSEETGKLAVWTEREKERTKLFVEDNGEGIQEKDIRRIFEKGYTGSNYHNGKYKSTGMGLYMVSRIIDRLGHEIWVESEYGRYTRFCIVFYKPFWESKG